MLKLTLQRGGQNKNKYLVSVFIELYNECILIFKSNVMSYEIPAASVDISRVLTIKIILSLL